MVNKDFFKALDDLEAERKINKETFIATLETALTSAYKKMYGEAKSAMVKLYPERNTIRIFSYKTVVENVEDPDKEISLEEARQIKKSYKVGDIVSVEETTKDLEELPHKPQNKLLCKNFAKWNANKQRTNSLKKRMNF